MNAGQLGRRGAFLLAATMLVLIGSASRSDAASNWTLATVESPTFGHAGPVRDFNVRVETSLGVDADVFATTVLAILNDNRSWISVEDVRFRLSADADVDFTISLASPRTTDELCRPFRTVGRLSCRNGSRVVLNVDRWNRGPDVYHASYANNLAGYRQYLVNHEVGHFLGKGHVFPRDCTSARRAPVMMQQTFGLRGCATNGWPRYDDLAVGPIAELGNSIGAAWPRGSCPIRRSQPKLHERRCRT